MLYPTSTLQHQLVKGVYALCNESHHWITPVPCLVRLSGAPARTGLSTGVWFCCGCAEKKKKRKWTGPNWLTIRQSFKACRFPPPPPPVPWKLEETGSCDDVILCFGLFPHVDGEPWSFVFGADKGRHFTPRACLWRVRSHAAEVSDGSREVCCPSQQRKLLG